MTKQPKHTVKGTLLIRVPFIIEDQPNLNRSTKELEKYYSSALFKSNLSLKGIDYIDQRITCSDLNSVTNSAKMEVLHIDISDIDKWYGY